MNHGGRDDDWYTEWVQLHVQATGADAAAVRALLSPPVHEVLVGTAGATAEELGTVTVRLIARHETPKFPSEHADAVGKELERLRAERRAEMLPEAPAAPGDFAPDCDACHGSGLATVPDPRCLWHGRVVLARSSRTYMTTAVLCDRPACRAGEAARQREAARMDDRPARPTLRAFARIHGVDDPVALHRGYEREQARTARRRYAAGHDEWLLLVASIQKRALEAGGA